MDLLVDPTSDDSAKVSQAVSSLNFSGFERDSFSKPGVQAPLKLLHYADVITPSRNGLSFEVISTGSVLEDYLVFHQLQF